MGASNVNATNVEVSEIAKKGPQSFISNQDIIEMEIPHKGELVKVLKTHKGSMSLQNFIKKATNKNLTDIINEISNKLPELITDMYANYFIQKLLHNVSSE